MFYRLKPDYILRGWDKMTGALIKRPENKVRILSKETFQVLLVCDGETDLAKEMLDESWNNILRRLETEEIIESREFPNPLEKDQRYHYYNNRYVEMVFWSVTGKCNFRCRHCFMDAPNEALGELSTEEALGLIDQMAMCGVLRVDITGGEPFVRKDFWQLVDRILSYKIVIGKIYTNGWMLNEKILDQFERRNIKPEFSISFDGVGWHDWMRGVSGAEKAAIYALKLCNKRGFATDVEMCIHRGNIDTLSQTAQTLCEIGVKKLKVSNVAQTTLWNHRSDGMALTQKEYIESMIEYIPIFFKENQPIDLIICNIIILYRDRRYKIIAEAYDGTEKCLNNYICGGARWACYITPDGRLLPCMPMTASPEQVSFPKVQGIGLKQGLSNSFYMKFVNRRVKDLFVMNQECGSCSFRLKCGGGCRASALIEGNHNLMGCDRIMCLLWKEGYVERIYKVTEEAIKKYGEDGRFEGMKKSL